MIKKLTNHKASKCHVEIRDNGNLDFYSYTTLVITVKDGWMKCNGLYSATTRRQISWFMKEYLPEYGYNFAKMLYESNARYNVFTGQLLIADK